jgi:hypothetical protein
MPEAAVAEVSAQTSGSAAFSPVSHFTGGLTTRISMLLRRWTALHTSQLLLHGEQFAGHLLGQFTALVFIRMTQLQEAAHVLLC